LPDTSLALARDIVLHHGWNATAYQILNPGLELWFAGDGDAVAGSARHGRTRVVAGAPVCAPGRLEAVARELEAAANASGERVLFFGAGARLEKTLRDHPGHAFVPLGAQPVWDPQGWNDIVRRKASLRAQLHRASNKGVSVTEWPADRAEQSQALRRVLAEWLATRGLPPLGFMVTPNLFGQLRDRRVFVAEQASSSEVVAFLIATPVPARQGWLVEQWPRVRAAPNGTTHLLVDAAMRAFAESGSRYATLGLAPLSHRGRRANGGDLAWLRWTLGWVRAHGRRFYNFEGLEAFKASLQPDEWETIYAIAQAPRFTPSMLHAVAGVFSGGSPEWFVARAVAAAAGQEIRRALGGTRR
jgi:phosphatidylglycerol lysyltransferase